MSYTGQAVHILCPWGSTSCLPHPQLHTPGRLSYHQSASNEWQRWAWALRRSLLGTTGPAREVRSVTLQWVLETIFKVGLGSSNMSPSWRWAPAWGKWSCWLAEEILTNQAACSSSIGFYSSTLHSASLPCILQTVHRHWTGGVIIGLDVIFPVCFIYKDRKSAGTGIENNYYRTERNWSKPDSLTWPGITWQEHLSEELFRSGRPVDMSVGKCLDC